MRDVLGIADDDAVVKREVPRVRAVLSAERLSRLSLGFRVGLAGRRPAERLLSGRPPPRIGSVGRYGWGQLNLTLSSLGQQQPVRRNPERESQRHQVVNVNAPVPLLDLEQARVEDRVPEFFELAGQLGIADPPLLADSAEVLSETHARRPRVFRVSCHVGSKSGGLADSQRILYRPSKEASILPGRK